MDARNLWKTYTSCVRFTFLDILYNSFPPSMTQAGFGYGNPFYPRRFGVQKSNVCGVFRKGRANRNSFLTTTTVVMTSVIPRRNAPEKKHAQICGS